MEFLIIPWRVWMSNISPSIITTKCRIINFPIQVTSISPFLNLIRIMIEYSKHLCEQVILIFANILVKGQTTVQSI